MQSRRPPQTRTFLKPIKATEISFIYSRLTHAASRESTEEENSTILEGRLWLKSDYTRGKIESEKLIEVRGQSSKDVMG